MCLFSVYTWQCFGLIFSWILKYILVRKFYLKIQDSIGLFVTYTYRICSEIKKWQCPTAAAETVRYWGGEDPSWSYELWFCTSWCISPAGRRVWFQWCVQPSALLSAEPSCLEQYCCQTRQWCFLDALYSSRVEGLKDPHGDSEFPQLPEVV